MSKNLKCPKCNGVLEDLSINDDWAGTLKSLIAVTGITQGNFRTSVRIAR